MDEVKGGTPGWQQRYYFHHHGIKVAHKKEFIKYVNNICDEYLKGTLWILNYYQGKQCSWSWYYPYNAAPAACDLVKAQLAVKSEDIEFDGPVSPFVQLMSVLPPESASLLPPCLAYYMTSRHSFIHYMYPIKINVHMLGHKWYHECKARMPYIDRNLLADIVERHMPDFSEEEQLRNNNRFEVIKFY